MRVLIREGAWTASLDREPVALNVPAVLVRTRLTAGDDAAWLRRCPRIEIFEVPRRHYTLFEPKNVRSLRDTFFTATRDWRRDTQTVTDVAATSVLSPGPGKNHLSVCCPDCCGDHSPRSETSIGLSASLEYVR